MKTEVQGTVMQLATGVGDLSESIPGHHPISHLVGIGDSFFKHPACEADCSTTSCVEFKNEWNSTLPCAFMACITVTSLYITDTIKIECEILVWKL